MPTVYAAMRNAVLAVRGGPDDWRAAESLTGRTVECVAAHPDRPERVFCGTYESGLHRSTDAGDTWETVGAEAIDPPEPADVARRRGVDAASVMTVAINPDDPDELWIGTEPSAVYRSTDAGDTWRAVPGLTDLSSASEWSFPPRPYTHHVRWIEVDPADPARVYVGIEAGAFVLTPDRGDTWIERPPGSRFDNHSLATHADAPGRVYAAAGDGYAESTDAGESWTHPESGLDHRYVWSVAVDPGDPDVRLVSSASGASRAHGHGGAASAESYVYRARGALAGNANADDRGDESWERLDGRGLPTGEAVLRAVLESGVESGELYAVNNRGLYRTPDAGDSWTRLDLAWPDRYGVQAPRGLAVV